MKKIIFLLIMIMLTTLSYANLTNTVIPVTKDGAANPPTLQNGSITDTGTSSGSGNVGIGSPNPGTALDVQGTIKATYFSGDARYVRSLPLVTSPNIHALGDSLSIQATNWLNQINNDAGMYYTARAVSGSQACDVADAQAFTSEAPAHAVNNINPFYTFMIGANDANIKGAGSYEAVYSNCSRAVITWLAIPNELKVLGQAAGCVATGTWSNAASYGGAMGKVSNTNGDTLACTMTTYGAPLYAWYKMDDAKTGTFTYSVDGGTASSTITTQQSPLIATTNGGTKGVGLIRVPSLSAGSHTITFTITSSTNATNTVEIEGIGTVDPNPYYQQGTVFVGGVTRQQNDTAAADTLAYNNDALANVQLLQNDGLPVVFVPVRDYINSTTDMANQLHMNTTGYNHMEMAYLSYMQLPRTTQWTSSSYNNPMYELNANVGIGTFTNNGVLNVQTSGTTSKNMLSMLSPANTAGNGPNIVYGVNSSNNNQMNFQFNYVGAGSTSNYTKMFYQGSTGSLVLQATGNVGVGSISPGQTLDVFGTTRISQQLFMPAIASDTGKTDATGCIDTTTGQFYKGTGTIGICLGTSTKDAKQNIIPIKEGLAQIMALKPISFNYKEGWGYDATKPYYGFLAEDVASILPRLVGRDEKGKPRNADYVGMIPILVRSIQEMQEEIDALKNAKTPTQ